MNAQSQKCSGPFSNGSLVRSCQRAQALSHSRNNGILSYVWQGLQGCCRQHLALNNDSQMALAIFVIHVGEQGKRRSLSAERASIHKRLRLWAQPVHDTIDYPLQISLGGSRTHMKGHVRLLCNPFSIFNRLEGLGGSQSNTMGSTRNFTELIYVKQKSRTNKMFR